MLSPHLEEERVGLKLYQPFSFWDNEIFAVVVVLLGLFQMLLAIPMYFMDISLPLIYLLPLSVGCMFVIAGSVTVACEKTPGKLLLKSCACTNVVGAVGAMCALMVNSSSINALPPIMPCNITGFGYYSPLTDCPDKSLTNFFLGIITLLFLYQMLAFILQALLSFSAIKGLKSQPN